MKPFKKSQEEQRQHNMMNTEHNKISQGAEFIGKVTSMPKGDSWRRKTGKKKGQKNHE